LTTNFQNAEITSKHGVINACNMVLDTDTSNTSAQRTLDALGQGLVGQRYAFLDHSSMHTSSVQGQTEEHAAVLKWLEGEMVE
jgi:hypothetical protein